MDYSFITVTSRESTAKEFIAFWQPVYSYMDKDYLYADTINKEQFSAEDIYNLFEWKNGMKTNGHIKKEKSINHVVEQRNIINILKKKFEQNLFDEKFDKMSAVWRIFLMHIISPEHYPIFDQHVYRAFIYLREKRLGEIPKTNKQKFSVYDEYREFIEKEFLSSGMPKRSIDQALWAFGKFLKTNYARQMIVTQ